MTKTLAVLGAGKVGTALGRLASRAGWDVRLTGSANQQLQALIVETLVPGGRLLPEGEAVDGADLVVVAVPFGKHLTVAWQGLDGKVVVDAMNYWEAVDGTVQAAEGLDAATSTTSLVAAQNPAMRLVKSFNHLGYDDLETDARPRGHETRRGMIVASDDVEAAQRVAHLIDDIGFDPLLAPRAAAKLLEPGGPIFGIRLTRAQMQEILRERLGEDVAARTVIPDLP